MNTLKNPMRAALIAASLLLGLPGLATAATVHLSQGALAGNGAFDTFFGSASADGSRVFFETSEPLAATDTDTSTDIYLRDVATGVTSHLSQGALAGSGNGAFDAFFRGASADSSRVFFITSEPLAATDSDTSIDIYMRDVATGVTSHLSQGAINGNGAFSATFRGASADGSRVFFVTDEPLAATDTDASTDIYMRNVATGVTSHLSQGAINGNGAFSATFRGASADGSRVFFTTGEPLAGTDTDTNTDIYLRDVATGVTSHISQGAINGNGAVEANFAGASNDGSRVFFITNEPLAATDTDTSTDIYLRDVATGVTSHLSQGAINGNGAFDASFRGASADGSRVFFVTSEPLAATDTDASFDIYLREVATGVTSHLSQGAVAGSGNGAFDATFSGASADGSRVFLETSEPLAATDTDTSTDIYLREVATGVTSHISQGALAGSGNGAFRAFFRGASADGSRVFFVTSEPLAGTDSDTSSDIYLRDVATGVTSHISQGAINGNGAFDATFRGASADSSRVFFTTDEPLAATDTDTSTDIYAAIAVALTGSNAGGAFTMLPLLLLSLLGLLKIRRKPPPA